MPARASAASSCELQAMETNNFGQYVFEQRLGSSSTSEVWRARARANGERVAIKFPSRHVARIPEWRRRFDREIAILIHLRHPRGPRMRAWGETHDGRPFLATEWVPGETLSDQLADGGALPAHTAGAYFRQLADVLDAVHAMGFLHRDIKLENIIIRDGAPADDCLTLLDLGFAEPLGAIGRGVGQSARPIAIGTPCYMSPEEVQGRPLDSRSDVYSLGIALFAMLTGTLPFDETNDQATMQAHVRMPIPRFADCPTAHPTSARVEPVVRWALAKDPADRPASAVELAGWYDRALRGETLPVEIQARSNRTAIARTDGPNRIEVPVGLAAVVLLALSFAAVW